MTDVWATRWDDDDEHERLMELNQLATSLMVLFDDYDLVDSELLAFLGDLLDRFFEELISASHPPDMIRLIFEDFAKKLVHNIMDNTETQKVIEAYENSIVKEI